MNLTAFWTQLETNFPLGGARRRLRELLGDDVELALEQADVLVRRRVATRYPCLRWAGDACPRVVHQRADGSAVASCGNATAQCGSLEMTAEDVEFLSVSPQSLASVVGAALQFRVNVKPLSGIMGGYRFGTFMPEPDVRHAVYFLACRNERSYSRSVDALRTHAAGWTLAILVPTDRFISESLRRQMASAGIPLISLADTVGLRGEGRVHALVDPLQLFANAGVAAAVSAAPTHVAHALVRERGRAPAWRRLDHAAYERLVADAAAYDVVADELAKVVIRERGKERIENVPASYFRWIGSALEKRRHYDPGTGDDDGVAAKQLFQRARRVFDIKSDDRWAIFPTELVDNRAVYRFDPKASVTFAFVFAPNSGGPAPRSSIEDERTPVETLVSRSRDRRPGL